MGVQNKYGFSTVAGAAGGIFDLAPYAIDSFINEENNGAIRFGEAAFRGTKAGLNVKKAYAGATADKFEGIITNDRCTEYDVDGNLSIRKGASLGVMRYGRIYARLAEDVTPAVGDKVYVVLSGDDAGCFTNDASGNVEIAARFLGTKDASANIALVELFNAPAPNAVEADD